jgi:hypothetical protein
MCRAVPVASPGFLRNDRLYPSHACYVPNRGIGGEGTLMLTRMLFRRSLPAQRRLCCAAMPRPTTWSGRRLQATASMGSGLVYHYGAGLTATPFGPGATRPLHRTVQAPSAENVTPVRTPGFHSCWQRNALVDNGAFVAITDGKPSLNPGPSPPPNWIPPGCRGSCRPTPQKNITQTRSWRFNPRVSARGAAAGRGNDAPGGGSTR